jgi:hypothetical protein
MSVGVTYSTATDQYEIFGEPETADLLETMSQADLVIGFNHIDFDYQVLQAYSVWDVADRMKSFDLLHDIERRLGHRIKLDDIATATLGTGKTADGLDAIRWWREGKILQIAEYCCFDVKVTRMVHEYGVAHGNIRYRDRFGSEQTLAVEWPDWRTD